MIWVFVTEEGHYCTALTKRQIPECDGRNMSERESREIFLLFGLSLIEIDDDLLMWHLSNG
jgi:hypothetical protein